MEAKGWDGIGWEGMGRDGIGRRMRKRLVTCCIRRVDSGRVTTRTFSSFKDLIYRHHIHRYHLQTLLSFPLSLLSFHEFFFIFEFFHFESPQSLPSVSPPSSIPVLSYLVATAPRYPPTSAICHQFQGGDVGAWENRRGGSDEYYEQHRNGGEGERSAVGQDQQQASM
eukprot:356057-Hanusia_phi.AAC.2